MAEAFGFPKEARLRRRREFLRVQQSGRRRHSRHFVVVSADGAPDRPTRLGITVSARVGNAVARNRVKRLVRELFRMGRIHLRTGKDIVVIAKEGADRLRMAEMAAELGPAWPLRT